MENLEKVERILEESAQVKLRLKQEMKRMVEAAQILRNALDDGGKVLTCGNGGSAADAQHFAAELVVKYQRERRAFPAISLSVNPSTVTAASNDLGYDSVFSRQLEALGNSGDVLLAISTSGRSPNVNNAVRTAKEKGMKIIYLTGGIPPDPGTRDLCDLLISVPSDETPRIQEAHITILHILADLIES